jgi:cytochrome P450
MTAMQPVDIYEALLEEGIWENPYPLYAALHEHGTVLPIGDGLVLVPGYHAARSVLGGAQFLVDDAEIFDRVDETWRAHPALNAPNLLSINGSDHARIRELLGRRLTRRRVQDLKPSISAQVDRLLDEMALAGADADPVDYVAAFAYPLPAVIICELIGATGWDLTLLRDLSRSLTAVLEPDIDDELLARGDEAAVTLGSMFSDLVADRRARARDDLISDLVAAASEREARLSEAELIHNLILLLVAGFECSMNLLGSGLHVVFNEPRIRAGLISGRVTPASFVEELLRYEPPIGETGRRLAKSGEIDGVAVDSDDEIVLLLGAANRDPRRFADPDVFAPERGDGGSLSFGAGAHFCLGAALARLQSELAFPRLVRRFPGLVPAGPAERRPSAISRGFDRMPISLG